MVADLTCQRVHLQLQALAQYRSVLVSHKYLSFESVKEKIPRLYKVELSAVLLLF